MHIETWIFWLGIELIVFLLVAIAIITFIHLRYHHQNQLKIRTLMDKLKHKSSLLKKHKQQKTTSPDQQAEIDALKEQLLNEMKNPFLQEKIDALIAEIEDLREIADKVKPLEQEIEQLRKKTGNPD